MRVLVQWTKANPTDWLEIDLDASPRLRRIWERLASKPEPTGGEVIDDTDGWIMSLNIQGIHFGGFDHYAAEPVAGGGLRVTCWNDDPVDWPVGTRQARVWTFFDPAPDDRVGGQINTRQTLTVYDEDPAEILRWTGAQTSSGPVEVLPWAAFTPPTSALTRHGIWVSDALFEAHRAARRLARWQEWATP